MFQSDMAYLTKEEATTALEKKLNSTNFKIKTFNFKPMSDEVAGFMCEHLLLTIKVERDNSEEDHTFFCKTLPKSVPAHLNYIDEIGAFEKEVKLFLNLLPLLQNISSDQWSPRSYFAKSDIIVMEDLSKDEFCTCTKYLRTLFDYDHILLAAATVAKLHAASLIYEKKHCFNGDTIVDFFPNLLIENTYVSEPTHVRKLWMDVGIEAVLRLIRAVPELNEESKMVKINKKLPEMFRLMPEIASQSKNYLNVFGHADLWCNNIMFQYNTEGKPVKCVLVDYQFARYAPPAMDLMPLIVMTTTKKDRDAFLPQILDTYYEVLKNELQRNVLDINNIFPRSEFESTCRQFECAGLVEALLFGQATLLPGDLAKQVVTSPDGFFAYQRDINSRSKITLEAFQRDKFFRERITEMVTCLVENFIL